jgi:carbonic anhydrase
MMRRARPSSYLIFGLFLALSAHAEEHAAPAKPAAAAKPAEGATKLAVAKTTSAEPAKTPVAEAAKSTAAEASTKPAPLLIFDARPAVVSVTERAERPQPKQHKRAAPVRVALANTNAATKTDAHAATPPAAPAPAHGLHWSYEGATGPQAWARLAPEYAKCGNGERQSPIDIRDGMKLDLEPITFEYRPSGFKVVDNGHTIQANVGGWNSMRVMGRRFRLVQFHFHSPSEEAIDGRQYEMVVHLVHKDSEDRLAVVAVLVESGARQPAIQTVLNHLPLEKGTEAAAATNLDMNQMLPENRRYFTYMGSLTTPPCSEDVLWIVMKQPVQASMEQLNIFARLYPMNARPIQSARGRMIKESN